ncbi:MAG: glycosyltransferase family 4 protein [bacterium]
MKKILVICEDRIGEKMAGPGIRSFEMCKFFSQHFFTILALPNSCKKTKIKCSFEIKFADFGNTNEMENFIKDLNPDVLLFNSVNIGSYYFLQNLEIPIIIDLYVPTPFENLELNINADISLEQKENFYNDELMSLKNKILIGDYFLCANEKQKDLFIGMFTILGKINPKLYLQNKTFDNLINVVPFGISSNEPIHSKQVIKGVYRGIDEKDFVLIWAGGIWEWLDPLTVIKALNLVLKKRRDVKLLFLGTKHPAGIPEMQMFKKAKELSIDLGLYNNFVFFNEDWINYEDRQNFLLEADIGISAHFSIMETQFSFRTRILDYFWAKLPMILTKGDVLSEFVQKNSLGEIIDYGDVNGWEKAILKLIENKELYSQYCKNIALIRGQFVWDKALEPLIEFCKNSSKKPKINFDQKMKVNLIEKNQQEKTDFEKKFSLTESIKNIIQQKKEENNIQKQQINEILNNISFLKEKISIIEERLYHTNLFVEKVRCSFIYKILKKIKK